jgi:F-type H+-transporting ATPase subunit delta
MIALKTQARPYANALFELASEEDNCQGWHTVLTILRAVIDNDDVREMLKVRSIAAKEWVEWIQSIHPEWLGKKEVGNLLLVLAEKRRLLLLPAIFQLFDAKWRESKNEKRFQVNVPKAWTQAESQRFRDFLNKRFACQAEVSVEVHPEILGGAEVIGEGWRLDYSLRGWLEQLREQLSSGTKER